ncbi:hypothetical protein COO60DRAFT_1643826 [Scenedesmus sp. NREL 46B-D3]|nr:hypothetical protein COO60DRAFT_1643826 [Scenedesmus sp. NREL 46B-D3]
MLYYPFDPSCPCPDCGQADTIFDERQGDAVCRACGLVRASHLISDQVEYRCFVDESEKRVAPASTNDSGVLRPSKMGDARLDKLNLICAGTDNTPRVSADFYQVTERSLNVPPCVVADAVAMFRGMRPGMGILSTDKQRTLEALCVYYACMGATRLRASKTKEQVCGAFGVPLATFWQVNGDFTNASIGKPWYKLVTNVERAPDMLPSLLNKVGLMWTCEQRMQATTRVTALYQQHHRRVKQLCVRGVLAAMLFLACQQDDASAARRLPRLTKAQLAAAANITPTTISNNLRLLAATRGKPY